MTVPFNTFATGLTAASSLTGAEVVVVEQGGNSRQTTVGAFTGSIGGQFNITPDTHPFIPSGVGLGPNDEFESGSTIDTGGTRYSGATAWTAVNALTSSANVSSGSLVFSASIQNGVDYNIYEQPVAGATFTYQAKISGVFNGGATNNSAAGILLAASGGAFVLLGLISGVGGVAGLTCRKLTSPTGTSTVINNLGGAVPVVVSDPVTGNTQTIPVYLQVTYDGTNIIMSVSQSGVHGTFDIFESATATSLIGGAPTEVGLAVNNQATSAQSALMVCDWFRRTA
jgi:hypothetical protein